MDAPTKDQYAMQDPTKQYSRPKFEDPPQSAPGLAQDMAPKPDHGEDSYRGFGRLEGRRAIITGANSDISDEAFCTALIEEGRAALGGIDILVNNAGRQTAAKELSFVTGEVYGVTGGNHLP